MTNSGINVLSLFDGISCGQIALERAGIKVDKYFASEIDKHAIKVTQQNYPNTIQLGSIVDLKSSDLPKIDLLIGGSPCQGFSFAGKQLNFEDPRSKLFFEYVRLLNDCKPDWFLLENVKMKVDSERTISGLVNVNPVQISSSFFSAQSRERLYWSNIPFSVSFVQNNCFLCDILEQSVDLKYNLVNNYTLKSNNNYRLDILEELYRKNHKTHQQKPVLVSEVCNDTPSGRSRQTDRLYSSLSKSPALLANRSKDMKIDCGSADKTKWRNLTPVECERLQTVPDNYTSMISDNKRYQVLGNGWTVDVISYILDFLPDEYKK